MKPSDLWLSAVLIVSLLLSCGCNPTGNTAALEPDSANMQLNGLIKLLPVDPDYGTLTLNVSLLDAESSAMAQTLLEVVVIPGKRMEIPFQFNVSGEQPLKQQRYELEIRLLTNAQPPEVVLTSQHPVNPSAVSQVIELLVKLPPPPLN